jgi:signal transduction histidine kinase
MMNVSFLFILVVIFTLGTALFIIHRHYQLVQNELDQLLQGLDAALGGSKMEYESNESICSAIAERVNKLTQSFGMHKNQAIAERDIVKSLIADISHQVRTPLTNILLYTELLREQRLEKNLDQLTEKIQIQSEKLNFYMKELLQSSYTHSDMIIVNPEKNSVTKLLACACQAVELAALKKEIIIHCENDETVNLQCSFDLKWTLEAMTNILDNAIKYSPMASNITISVSPNEAFTCIHIQDQGIGICEKEQGLIFQKFYRSAKVKEAPGFGIGLFLAREILSRQGGYIKVTSPNKNGSIFSVYLPNYTFSS